MKVLHVACIAPPETGGIGQSASEMVKRLRRRGVDALLVSRERRIKRGEEDPAWVKRLPAPLRWGNGGILTGLKSLMRNHDVIHLHYPFFGTAEAVAQDCLFMKKPLVITFHMDVVPRGIIGTFFDAYRMTAQPAILRSAKKIFVSSTDYADHSSIRGFRKAHPDRVIELPFGVDESFAPGTPDRGRFGLSAEGRVVGFVGGLDRAHAFKGLPVLLKAMTLLPTSTHLLIVGDGDMRRVHERTVKDLGLADRCHFAGRVSSEVLPDVYRAMDVLAFPSTSAAEAFGLVAVEAMATGIPVVASHLPGVRTVVSDGTSGMLVPPSNPVALAEALKRMLENDSLREGMGRAARERAIARFNWETHVDGLMNVYRELRV